MSFNTPYSDYDVKNTLVEIFDAELQRVDGLIESMEPSKSASTL